MTRSGSRRATEGGTRQKMPEVKNEPVLYAPMSMVPLWLDQTQA
jgi:hypothetical protein